MIRGLPWVAKTDMFQAAQNSVNDSPIDSAIRLRIEVQGTVQGVGFRPFVHRLASTLQLTGWVRNDARGVLMEVQGPSQHLTAFKARLKNELPPLAELTDLVCSIAPRCDQEREFTIAPTLVDAPVHTQLLPDMGVCDTCLTELFTAGDRRYRYSFITCTDCGPRFTLTRTLPFERAHTTMAPFRLCPACQHEYDTPAQRRFHAQAIACPACGPRWVVRDAAGVVQAVDDPIAATWHRLQAGEIVAVKGVGGFHLVCDAHRSDAIEHLRERKQRGAKPFALMALNVASVAKWACVSAAEKHLLESKERPIVLLDKGLDRAVLQRAAPKLQQVGVMLPYTPLHYLLFHHAAGLPGGHVWLSQSQDACFVMTSANVRGDPLVTDNAEAVARLRGIADAYLMHDREILVTCDDSVVRVIDGAPVFLRRGRGYAPGAVTLPEAGPSVAACGAYLKNTVCLTRGNQAFVSQYVGDLRSAAVCRAQASLLEHATRLCAVQPVAIACDLHPDFPSTHLAARLATAYDIPLVQVQHHHAHAAAVAAEHGLRGPLLALTLDGMGYGADGQAWGGELLQLDGAGEFRRLGHFLPLALPGGERAVSEPWRVAAAVLCRLDHAHAVTARWPQGHALREQLVRNINVVYTSSAGRLFDAAAALLGVCEGNSFEAEAAMRLEALATRHGAVVTTPDLVRFETDGTVDILNPLALLERLADETNVAYGAALFHSVLAQALVHWLMRYAQQTGINHVLLAGGCFLNRLLTTALTRGCEAVGLRVYRARQVSPGDEGVSLGQAWVAQQRLAAGITDNSRA